MQNLYVCYKSLFPNYTPKQRLYEYWTIKGVPYVRTNSHKVTGLIVWRLLFFEIQTKELLQFSLRNYSSCGYLYKIVNKVCFRENK